MLLLLTALSCRSKDYTYDSTGVPEDTSPEDLDGDGFYGDEDCDDSDPGVYPGAIEFCDGVDNDCDGTIDEDDAADAGTWYDDNDADGYGDTDASSRACEQPSGTSELDEDCDDADEDIYPGAPEDDCADPVDYNCDGSVGYADVDGDGWAACEDCDDTDADLNPDAVEVCDTIDNDCDGDIDDLDSSLDTSTGVTWWADADGDGYGDVEFETQACEEPSGYVDNADDCDDADGDVNPSATEVCDKADNDCDGDIDEDDAADAGTWYDDSDGDGYGDADTAQDACEQPSGTVTDDTDCDDADGDAYPGAAEYCDGVDTDCDGALDEDDALDAETWYQDGDGDGYGHSARTLQSCDQPSGYVSDSTDCDDADADVNPGETEVCNDTDDDCDSSTDEGVTSTYYADADGDGYGDASSTTEDCSVPSGFSTDSTDCDDADADVNPGETEVCNGTDDDCDSSTDEGLTGTTATITTTSPSGSCAGDSNRVATLATCGCDDVEIAGSFTDNSDGSAGQVVSSSTSSSSFWLRWDDAPSGGDCDLDISGTTSWSASKSGTTLSVSVTHEIDGYDAGNSLTSGYSITDNGSTEIKSGSTSSTYTYTCDF